MQTQNGVVDVIRRPAVVIDDRHTRHCLEQRLALHLIGPVRIDDDQQRAVVRLDQRVVAGDENPGVFRQRAQLTDKRPGGVVFQIEDDAGALALLPAEAHETDRRADGVEVRHAVAHDEHLTGLRDQLRQGACDHARLDLGVALGLLGASAVEREVVAVLDDGLIAAA